MRVKKNFGERVPISFMSNDTHRHSYMVYTLSTSTQNCDT